MAFVRWCVAEGNLDHDPTARLKLPKAEKRYIRVFTDEEIKRLHKACMPSAAHLAAIRFRQLKMVAQAQ